MKVGIIGGGSIGLLFGAYLGQRHEVTIFTRRKEQEQRIKDEGIRLLSPEKSEKIIQVHAESKNWNLSDQELIFVTVKQYDLERLKPVLLKIPSNIPICFIQNGMGHLELLNALPHETIFVGTVEHGAKRRSDCAVSHNGAGTTNLALFRGASNMDKTFIGRLDTASFPISIHKDYQIILINKLIANALINPLTVIFNVKNGRLIENAYYFQIFKLMFEEMYKVFPMGDKEKIFNNVMGICQNTKSNTSSMLADVLEGRRTEIDAILGYILKAAERKGANLPTVQVIYAMVKGMEQERR